MNLTILVSIIINVSPFIGIGLWVLWLRLLKSIDIDDIYAGRK